MLVLTLPQSAHASAVYCYGQVERLYVSRASSVVALMSYRRDYTQVCQLNNSWKGVPVETSKSWFAMLQSSYVAKSNMIIQYDDLTVTSCDTIPTYGSAAAPGYIMVK